jgi:hypothetical protein
MRIFNKIRKYAAASINCYGNLIIFGVKGLCDPALDAM